MIEVLIYWLLIIFPLGQLTRLPLSRGEACLAPTLWCGINIYLHDLIVVVLLLFWLGKKILKKEKFYWPKLTKFILFFCFAASFSLLLAVPYYQAREIMIASLYLFRWIAYSGIYFLITDLVRLKKLKSMTINNLLITGGVIAAILGLLQYIFMPDIRSLSSYDWDPHYYRVVGTYLDPGYTGMIYVLSLILIVVKLWQKKKAFKLKLAFVLIYLALALTYARSAYLAYLVGMGIIAWYKKSAKFFFTVLTVGMITVLLLPRPGGEGVRLERQSTIWSRINNWRQTIEIGLDQSLFGVGFNTYRYTQRDYGFLSLNDWQKSHAGAGADSSLLFIFATSGIVGLITYLCLLAKIFKTSWQKKSIILFASFGALLAHSFFNNSLFYAWIMLWMWILLAVKEYN